MNSSNNTYRKRTSGGQHGDVFTKPQVVEYMLDLVGYTADNDLSTVSIMEPSCGKGEFIMHIIHRLKESALRYDFDFNDAYHNHVFASDIDGEKVSCCIKRIKAEFPEIINPELSISTEDFLLANHGRQVDIVIGNPPYIRYEQIPKDKLDVYKRRYATFYYRADMYVLFFEQSLRLLKHDGKHCFICANRWMKNRYGRKLRELVARYYNLRTIINMEGADAFDEEVLAYPAITLIENNKERKAMNYAETTHVEALGAHSFKSLPNPESDEWDNVFNIDTYNTISSSIEAQGFKLGIGVATGADSIFISKNIKGIVEDELLVPAINARDLKGDRIQWGGRYLLNPYCKNGSLINLNDFPKAKRYFEMHKARLASRHKALRNPEAWYGTIDKVNPLLQSQPKILLPDISGNDYIFVDKGEYYPQHNIYYITSGKGNELELLAAILMSDYVRTQLNNVTNKMNGGYARWQSQHLRKLRIPTIGNINNTLAEKILECYHTRNLEGINRCTNEIICQERNTSTDNKRNTHQKYTQLNFLDLFDQYSDNPIVENCMVHEDIDIEYGNFQNHRHLPIDSSKNVLICNVKRDNREQYLDGSAKIYYTGKKFPTTVALNKLYYFMPYISGMGIRDLYYIKIARLGYRKEGQENEDKSDLRFVFEIERVGQLFDDYKKVKLEIWRTFTDTTMKSILAK